MSNDYTLPFEPGHIGCMQMREHEAEQLNVDLLCMVMGTDKGNCNTLMADGRVLALMGFYEVWPGVLEVFVIPSIYVPQHAKLFVSTTKTYLTNIAECHKAHRLQTASKADDETDRWMEALGFYCEGSMVNYTFNKITYKRWARLFDNG